MRFRPGPIRGVLLLLIALFGKWVLFLYYLTVHIRDERPDFRMRGRGPHAGGIYPLWHSHQLSIAWHCRGARSVTMVSRSADGEYIAKLAASLGNIPVRGSSSRGGIAGLKSLIEWARRYVAVTITPDGPRGPRQTIKPGLLMVARETGHAVTPVALGLSDFWEIPSWDRFRIPKPFSRGYFCYGEPLRVPPDADDRMLGELADELRRRMIALEDYADRMAASGSERAG